MKIYAEITIRERAIATMAARRHIDEHQVAAAVELAERWGFRMVKNPKCRPKGSGAPLERALFPGDCIGNSRSRGSLRRILFCLPSLGIAANATIGTALVMRADTSASPTDARDKVTLIAENKRRRSGFANPHDIGAKWASRLSPKWVNSFGVEAFVNRSRNS